MYLPLASDGCADQLWIMGSENLSIFQNVSSSKNHSQVGALSCIFHGRVCNRKLFARGCHAHCGRINRKCLLWADHKKIASDMIGI